MEDATEESLRVESLHALLYCERLFYIQEVEAIHVADAAVYAGRTLHAQLEDDGELTSFVLESGSLGVRGKVDALRLLDGRLVPYEHKKGRPRKGEHGPEPWPSDRIQLGAYAMLLEESTGRAIDEGRIRYHSEHALVRVPIDPALRDDVRRAIERARALRVVSLRPPVAENERLCDRCATAPVCLPEEARLASRQARKAIRLFPGNDERVTLHVVGHGSRVGRAGREIEGKDQEGAAERIGIHRVRAVAVHGYSSVSTQALSLCGDHGVGVHWFSSGGSYIGSFYRDDLAVQRRIRQFEALTSAPLRLRLARALVRAKVESQVRFLARAARVDPHVRQRVAPGVDKIRRVLSLIGRATSPAQLLGVEGTAAAGYFGVLSALLGQRVAPELHPSNRTRRPPRDPFNAMLSFGYGLLLKEVVQAIRGVGLDAAFGIYHTPRTAAPPLALDLIELFRVPVVDMAVVGAMNRGQMDARRDFVTAGQQVWLSAEGRKRAIEIIERRLDDEWRHPVLEYSLSYRRHIELEVRLLEKEWSGESGLFARTRLR